MNAVIVEAISPSPMSKDTGIPMEFIHPATTLAHDESTVDVPVINFDEQNEETIVRLVTKASSDWGLFQIVNHEIPREVIEKLQEVGKGFFELSQDEKEMYARPAGAVSIGGYETRLQREGTRGWVEFLFHIIWPPPARNYQFWPENPPTYRDACEEYTKHLHGVVNKLLKTLSMGLGLKEHELKEALGGEELVHILKINHYPPCPRTDLIHGIVPHTDPSAITILFPNDVQGLQLFKDDHWYDVECIPNALIVLIGDQLEILSNGKCKAGLHRPIVNKEKTRYSWAVFLEPPTDKEVGPHPQLVTEENPAKYNTKTFGDYESQKSYKFPHRSNASMISYSE